MKWEILQDVENLVESVGNHKIHVENINNPKILKYIKTSFKILRH